MQFIWQYASTPSTDVQSAQGSNVISEWSNRLLWAFLGCFQVLAFGTLPFCKTDTKLFTLYLTPESLNSLWITSSSHSHPGPDATKQAQTTIDPSHCFIVGLVFFMVMEQMRFLKRKPQFCLICPKEVFTDTLWFDQSIEANSNLGLQWFAFNSGVFLGHFPEVMNVYSDNDEPWTWSSHLNLLWLPVVSSVSWNGHFSSCNQIWGGCEWNAQLWSQQHQSAWKLSYSLYL